MFSGVVIYKFSVSHRWVGREIRGLQKKTVLHVLREGVGMHGLGSSLGRELTIRGHAIGDVIKTRCLTVHSMVHEASSFGPPDWSL